jgi:hypothetical protein
VYHKTVSNSQENTKERGLTGDMNLLICLRIIDNYTTSEFNTVAKLCKEWFKMVAVNKVVISGK